MWIRLVFDFFHRSALEKKHTHTHKKSISKEISVTPPQSIKFALREDWLEQER